MARSAAATPSASAIEPRQRDADRSQQAILAAARDEFAEHGLGGARMDRIAERAGLNKRLIYYYFDNKDDLFLRRARGHLPATSARPRSTLHLTDLPPAEAVRRLTEFTWNYYLEHPEFLTLLNSDNLHRARHLRASQRARELNSPLIADARRDPRARPRRRRSFRGGIDPVQLYISIAGAVVLLPRRTTTRCRRSSAAT